jgi:hypothetical protein
MRTSPEVGECDLFCGGFGTVASSFSDGTAEALGPIETYFSLILRVRTAPILSELELKSRSSLTGEMAGEGGGVFEV